MSKLSDERRPFNEPTVRRQFAAMTPRAMHELVIIYGSWEAQVLTVPEVFRDRAFRLLTGNLSVAPWMCDVSAGAHGVAFLIWLCYTNDAVAMAVAAASRVAMVAASRRGSMGMPSPSRGTIRPLLADRSCYVLYTEWAAPPSER